MLSFEPRIAVIDDKITEVNGIIEKYQKDGIGIKYFNAHLIVMTNQIFIFLI